MMAVVHQVEQYEGTVEQERFFLSACLFVSESHKPRIWSRHFILNLKCGLASLGKRKNSKLEFLVSFVMQLSEK